MRALKSGSTRASRRYIVASMGLLSVFASLGSAGAGALETLTLPGPSVGNGGMYLIDVQASYPEVNWDTLDRVYIPAAHYRFINLGNLPQRPADRPLVITNHGGQVRIGGLDFHYNFAVGGGSNWRLTGKWDAQAQTGDAGFPGHASGDYAGSRGRYGFLIDDKFEDGNSGLGIGGGATNFEVDFFEIRHVGFAGAIFKTDDIGSAHMENIRFHDNYVHDTDSEAVYFGSTQAEPQHKISGLRFYNNRLIRTGTEALQLGQMGGDSEIYNNVIAFGAIAWKNPFQNFQDSTSQIGARQGNTSIHHNVFIGGAGNLLILFSQNQNGDLHQPSDRLHIHDNYYSHSRNIGAYIHSQANGITRLVFEDNVYRDIDFQYDELNPGAIDHNAVFRVFNTDNPIEFEGNRWDGPQTFAQVAGTNVVQIDNSNVSLPPIEFVDSGFPADFDYLLLEQWTALSINDDPVFYDEGDFVMHSELFYECIEPGSHTNKEPGSHPETWMERPLPPDDFRLALSSPYQGIGLLDQQAFFADGFESGDLSGW